MSEGDNKFFEVYVTEQAERDLDSAAAYLAETLAAPSAALGLIDGFEDMVDSLEQTPEAFPLVRDEMLAAAGYHRVPIGHYAAYYTIDGERVYIERVLHERRRWQALVGLA